MKVRNAGKRRETISLQMTAMIDIVFLLLVFFILTFKVVLPEGDFQIAMPLAVAGPTSVDERPAPPPLTVRLRANADGQLSGISLNERSMKDFNALHNSLIGIVGTQTGPGSIRDTAEVQLDCDYGLKYEYVIGAITSISGYVTEGGQVVKLIEKIKFAPPKKAG